MTDPMNDLMTDRMSASIAGSMADPMTDCMTPRLTKWIFSDHNCDARAVSQSCDFFWYFWGSRTFQFMILTKTYIKTCANDIDFIFVFSNSWHFPLLTRLVFEWRGRRMREKLLQLLWSRPQTPYLDFRYTGRLCYPLLSNVINIPAP